MFLAVMAAALGLASPVPPAPQAREAPAQSASAERPQRTPVLDLPSVRRLFDSLASQRASIDEGERVAASAEVSLLADAVVADVNTGPLVFDGPAPPRTNDEAARALVTPAMRARDRVAYQLLSLGYSARETADVVSGRISKRALDAAQKMILVGLGHDAAADYLDRQYQVLAERRRPPVPPEDRRNASLRRFDTAIDKYASLHHLDAAIVRAVILVESAFDPAARSPAGAIGLMQLMPATARALGVDPTRPDENIEGGVRYLSELLRMFGGLELALVAYNGGPGFARRYARGETALYGETRGYVAKVLARLRAPR